MPDQTRKDLFERRKSALKKERASFDGHWKECAQFVAPRRGRFFVEDANKGGDRYNSIINSKATQALRVARAGLMAGSMSPARPWFKTETMTGEFMDFQPAKVWFSQCDKIVREILAQSNFYPMSSTLLGELLLFATGAMISVEDYEDVSRFYTLTIGSYYIGQDDRQKTNTLIRDYEMTTSQLMKKFGQGAVSPQVQTAYDKGDYDVWFPVTHIIEPNDDYRSSNKLSKYKKFRSCYYEPGRSKLDDKLLSEAGFDKFPAYIPRWDTTGEDVWGTDCPTMTALGDIKGLQIQERRKAQAIDFLVRPPLKGPAALRNVPIESLPGGVTIYDGGDSKGGLEPVYTVNPNLQEFRLDMAAGEERIDRAYYVHLFRAISDMPGIQPKNQLELNQRDQERLLELGPVLEHLHGEFLGEAVDDTFERAAAAGILPPAPREIQGQPLKYTFISALAMAQRSVGAGIIERNATFVAGLVSGGFPHAADKFDSDAAIDEYAEVTGLNPKLIVGAEAVGAARDAAAKEVAQQQQQQAANTGADTLAKGGAALASAAKGTQALGTTPAAGGRTSALDALTAAIGSRGIPNVFQK